jgi:hypothetical protein
MLNLTDKFPELLKTVDLPVNIQFTRIYTLEEINTANSAVVSNHKTHNQGEDMYIRDTTYSASLRLVTSFLSKPISKIFSIQ